MKKTNAMRILDSAKIKYDTKEYADDGEHALERGAAEELAKKLEIPVECVFKTIVMRAETKEVLVFCQCAAHEINLKKARTAAGVKEVTPVKQEELLGLTGYVRGGCSPIGMKKKFRTFIDTSVMNHEKVYISAGVRGEQIIIAPKDLVAVAEATVTDLILEERS
ncbi:MAG: aminoacyl-tRNA deacylase [Treponema sp.]|nr:aminoacyl-tRNA deacylase [Treponema sp.]